MLNFLELPMELGTTSVGDGNLPIYFLLLLRLHAHQGGRRRHIHTTFSTHAFTTGVAGFHCPRPTSP